METTETRLRGETSAPDGSRVRPLELPSGQKKSIWANVISIEVVWGGALQRRFFHVPELCKHLSKTARDAIVADVNRENQELKLADFTHRCYVTHAELKHQELLESLSLDRMFSRTIQDRATWITFFVNLLINAIYLSNLRIMKDADGLRINPYGGLSSFAYKNPELRSVLKALNVAQITLALFTLLLYAVVRAPVTYASAMRENDGQQYRSFLAIWTHSLTGYYVFYVSMAMVSGLASFGALREFYGPLCNSILLFDIWVKSATARDVMKAVIIPFKPLGATGILLLFTLYFFSFIYFNFYHDHFSFAECDDMLRCFQVTAGYGLRAGGGMGEFLFNSNSEDQDSRGDRYFFDLIFFVLVLIILLNVIFGIIIDTFSELREEKKEREKNTTQMCFICGVHKGVYDLLGSGVFKTHLAHEHNMWAYLKFMVFLWEQDRDDDDGLEQYVRNCIEEEDCDISWFPSHVSLLLESKKTEEAADQSSDAKIVTELVRKLENDSAQRHKLLAEQIEKLRVDMAGLKGGQSEALGLKSLIDT